MPKINPKSKGTKQFIPKRQPAEEIVPNVTVYTDLPPDVHGQLRCYLILNIDKFIWKGHNSSDLNIVVKWWGEQSQGTVFRTTRLPGIAKYGIKCGPKQFASYLNDMQSLTLDFIDSKSYRIQGEASLSVAALSKNNSIDQMAQIVQVSSDQVIGKVRISMSIVPIPRLFENNDEPTLDRESPIRELAAPFKTHSVARSPLKNISKENVFPSKQLKNKSVNDIINQVLQRSKMLKEELVKAQLKEVDDVDTIKQSIESNLDMVPSSCIKEVERDTSFLDESKPDNTLDLLFGKDHIDSVLKKHGLDVSLSSSSSTSTLNDTSLIEHLFYNRDKEHDISAVSSDSDIEEDIPKKSITTAKVFSCDTKQRDVSVLEHEPQHPLSYNKITALGRVNKCKLIVDDLVFDHIPSKGTYFIEYKVPIQDEIESKTITSRKISDKAIRFNHTNIFPLMFDEVLINQWDIRTVVFKIYYKERIEDSFKLIADTSLRLRNVMHADRFEYKVASQIRSIENDDYLGLLVGVMKLHGGDMSDVFVSKTCNPVPEKPRSFAFNLLIWVSCGKAIQVTDKGTVNSYVVIRMIDSVEKFSSDVVWDSHHPTYNCKHMIPFTYTAAFIDRLKENYIVIEVWNKTGTQDTLIGLGKLPTNQFYLSLSPTHLHHFVEQDTPVVAVDGYMPVVDILSNERAGILQCTLAVGTQSQLTQLLANKNIPTVVAAERDQKTPAHQVDTVLNEAKIQHTFRVTIQTIQEVDMFDGGSWGQTDCYVKFSLPTSASPQQPGPELKDFSTSTASTASFMKFHHASCASVILPESLSVQQCLSKHLEDNCLVLELWRRFYYPNVRDQMSARAVLTLQQLSHLISLNPNIEQTFHLPLDIVQHSTAQVEGNTTCSIGSVSVSVEYGKETISDTAHHIPNYVQFVVAINRACGLQYAARRVLEEGAPLEYAATVGVDSYVVMEVSFAGIQRETGVIARTFAPHYRAHFSVTLPTIMSISHSGPPTLAENLSKGCLNISVFHQVDNAPNRANDILLCKTSVQLEGLLTKHTGLHGWYALQHPTNSLLCLGGLEVEVGFGEITEREVVVADGCGRGWVPPPLPVLDTPYLTLQVCVDKIWIADHTMARYKSQNDVIFEDRECYIRTKFYNSDAVCSEGVLFSAGEITGDARCYGDVGGSQDTGFTCSFTFTTSTNLLWCLREESLEIQVWLLPRGGADIGDTILGCGYISLSSLLSSLHFPVSTAQVVPLVKGNSSNMGGAGLHAAVTLHKLHQLPDPPPPPPPPHHSLLQHESLLPDAEAEEEEEEIEGVKFRVTVEKCTNLPVTQYDTANLCVYCTVHCTSHTLLHTKYHEFTATINLDQIADITIPYTVFSDTSSNIVKFVLKTYDMKESVDAAVIGTATVDLAPLFIGFKSIEGWYLIEDIYSKDTFGQIKVSLVPLELLSREIISSKIAAVQEPQPVNNRTTETNFLKKPQVPATISRVYQQADSDVPDQLNIENVFKSLSDIDNMIRNIGSKPTLRSTGLQKEQSSTVPQHTGLQTIDKSPGTDERDLNNIGDNMPIYGSPVISPIKLSDDSDVDENEQFDPLQDLHPHSGEVVELDSYKLDDEDVGKNMPIYGSQVTDHQEACPELLDTFDITVDTDCLSDTICEISQLLQDVRAQSQTIDQMISSDDKMTSNDENSGKSSSTSNSGDTYIVDMLDTAEGNEDKEDKSNEDMERPTELLFPPATDTAAAGTQLQAATDQVPASCGDNVVCDNDVMSPDCQLTVKSGDKPGQAVVDQGAVASSSRDNTQRLYSVAPRTVLQFKDVPDFFMSAKQLSTTLTQIKQRTKSSETIDTSPELRSSTPVLNRRTPLYSLMRQSPSDLQKARIARIFKQ